MNIPKNEHPQEDTAIGLHGWTAKIPNKFTEPLKPVP